MTRENKAGLVVCGSFLCVVAAVVVMKLREPAAPDAPAPTSPQLALHSEPSPGLVKGNGPAKGPEETHALEAPALAPPVLSAPPNPVPTKVPPALVEQPNPPHQAEPPPVTGPMLTLRDPAPPGPVAAASAPGDPPGLPPPPPPPPSAPMEPLPLPPPSGQVEPLPPSAPMEPLAPPLPAPVSDNNRFGNDQNKTKPREEGEKGVPIPAPPPGPVGPPAPQPFPAADQIEPPPASVVAPPTIKIDPPPALEPPPPAPTMTKISPVAPLEVSQEPSAVIKIPSLPPPSPAGEVIASTAPSRPAPTAPTPLVDSWDERTYVCKPGDDFASICKNAYPGHSEEYAAALQMYNRNHPRAGEALRRDGVIGPGDRIYLPPSGVLERRHSDLIAKPKPKPVAIGSTGSEFGAVQASFPAPVTTTAPPATPTYTVKGGGERLWQIAVKQLNDGNRWRELAKLNPHIVEPNDPVPAGKVLNMPADFTAAPPVAAHAAPAPPLPPPPAPPLPGS